MYVISDLDGADEEYWTKNNDLWSLPVKKMNFNNILMSIKNA